MKILISISPLLLGFLLPFGNCELYGDCSTHYVDFFFFSFKENNISYFVDIVFFYSALLIIFLISLKLENLSINLKKKTFPFQSNITIYLITASVIYCISLIYFLLTNFESIFNLNLINLSDRYKFNQKSLTYLYFVSICFAIFLFLLKVKFIYKYLIIVPAVIFLFLDGSRMFVVLVAVCLFADIINLKNININKIFFLFFFLIVLVFIYVKFLEKRSPVETSIDLESNVFIFDTSKSDRSYSDSLKENECHINKDLLIPDYVEEQVEYLRFQLDYKKIPLLVQINNILHVDGLFHYAYIQKFPLEDSYNILDNISWLLGFNNSEKYIIASKANRRLNINSGINLNAVSDFYEKNINLVDKLSIFVIIFLIYFPIIYLGRFFFNFNNYNLTIILFSFFNFVSLTNNLRTSFKIYLYFLLFISIILIISLIYKSFQTIKS